MMAVITLDSLFGSRCSCDCCVACLQAYASALKQTEGEGLPAPPLSVGFTYELCAGIVDKSKRLQQIAAEEVRHC